MAQTTVGIRELKSQLSKYLRQVKAGRTIVITEHGKAVGRIVPPEIPLADKLEAMRQAGLIRWNGKKLTRQKPIVKLKAGQSLAALISEERR